MSRINCLGFEKVRKNYQYFWATFHYSSTARSWRWKQSSPVEFRLLPVETVPHPKSLESGTSKFPFDFFHSAYSNTLRPTHAHSCTNYWSIYMFGSLLPCNFDECKLSLILNNNRQEWLQETEFDKSFVYILEATENLCIWLSELELVPFDK